jgi:glucose dehydrogenase
LLVAEKFDPTVNWATNVDMKPVDQSSTRSTRRARRVRTSTSKDICPAALGSKDQQPATYDRKSGLILVPTNHVCMTYEPFQIEYTAGQPYVGATLTMYPAPNSHGGMGNFIAWDPRKARSSGRSRALLRVVRRADDRG